MGRDYSTTYKDRNSAMRSVKYFEPLACLVNEGQAHPDQEFPHRLFGLLEMILKLLGLKKSAARYLERL